MTPDRTINPSLRFVTLSRLRSARARVHCCHAWGAYNFTIVRAGCPAGDYSRPRGLSDAPYKLLILGDCGVGKSSIVTRYVADRFQSDSEPTVGVRTSTKSGVALQGGLYNVQLIELSGESGTRGETTGYIRR